MHICIIVFAVVFALVILNEMGRLVQPGSGAAQSLRCVESSLGSFVGLCLALPDHSILLSFIGIVIGILFLPIKGGGPLR